MSIQTIKKTEKTKFNDTIYVEISTHISDTKEIVSRRKIGKLPPFNGVSLPLLYFM